MRTKPYFETENGVLYHGDCLNIIPELEPVDLVLTDPPYGTTACKWDSIIPLEPMWEGLKRVIKPNGAIVMTAAQPFTTTLISSNTKMFKYCWVWDKKLSGGFAQAKNMPLKCHEDVVIFSNGATIHKNQSNRRMPYNPQGLKRIDKIAKNKPRHSQESAFGNRPSHKDEYVQEYTNYPKSILIISAIRGVHPTQKPVALMEYLIKTYTNEGETVLDFAAGSGTTAIASELNNRKWILIEKEEEFCEITVKRIEKETRQMKIPGC